MGAAKKSTKGSKKASKKGKKAMKVKRVSKLASGKRAKAAVFLGQKVKTRGGGLTKNDLIKSKSSGKIVSKKVSHNSRKTYQKLGLAKHGKAWLAAVSKARKDLKITGFQAVGGKTPKGKALLAKARSYYKKK